jgi:hypothetical protein
MATATEKVTFEVTVETTQSPKWTRLVQKEGDRPIATCQFLTERLPAHLREAGATAKVTVG